MQYNQEEMQSDVKWNKLQIFLSFGIGLALSILSIYLNYKNVRSERGVSVFTYWPSFRVPAIATLITYLIALNFVQEYKLSGKDTTEYSFSSSLIGYLFGAMPVIGLLLYPGLDQLHLGSDSAMIGLLLAFNTTQSFLLYREMQRGLGHKFDFTAVVIGAAINLAIVLVSPYAQYLTGGSGRYEADIHGE